MPYKLNIGIDVKFYKCEMRILRESKHITQIQLADALGVSRQTIINIESYEYMPKLPLAYRISCYFDCKIEDIFQFC
jgi:putative transcriptional regulator